MRVLCTAGHVDHGKSTLVRALTGTDPDRLAEEQRRGLTIELGFAWTKLEEVGDVAFVDLPGHERFVPTMLAGAGPVEVALLVVAADEGWMPQSAEHLAILRLLDVHRGVVALTRIDLVDAETVEIAAELVAEELVGSGLADAPVIPVSAVSGAGLDELRSALAEVLAAAPAPPDLGRARLWVDRAFSIHGAGTVVTGTLGGGSVASGDHLALAPGGQRVRVRGVQALGRPVEAAEPGWRVALNLVGVEVADVPRGTAVITPDRWSQTAAVDAWCTPERSVLGRRGAWRVHVGTAEVGASLYPTAGVDLDLPGPVRVELDRPLPLVAGDRLVIRDAGRSTTAGGGVVLDPLPRRRPRGRTGREEAVRRLTLLAEAHDPPDRVRALVADRGWLPAQTARAMAGATDDPVAGVEPVAPYLLSPARWLGLSAAVVDAVRLVHHRRPALPVVDRAEARRFADHEGVPPQVAEAVIDRVVAEGLLEAAPGGVRAPGHRANLTAAQQVARTALLQRLDAEGWEVEPLADVAAACGADDDLLAALARDSQVVLVDDGRRALSRATLDRAVSALRTLDGPFTAAQARDALGTSRRYALPLLEALDAAGITIRDGDLRSLTPL